MGSSSHPPAAQPHPPAQPPPAPYLQHCSGSRKVKGEDVLVVQPLNIYPPGSSMLYMVCDGHAGVETANFVATNFTRLLHARLPDRIPDCSKGKETEAYAETIRSALCETFVRLDNEWSTYGHLAGTTVTVALAIGWLLTVANAGDCGCVLDTGCSMLEMINTHRIHTSVEEQLRLKEARQYVASLGFHLQGPARPGEPGVGPLRIWPGGLCVARSIGDLDAGPEIVPVPHIRQVVMPQQGCRLILASDGLWDLMTYSKAVALTRSKPLNNAVQALMKIVSKDMRVMDDATICIVDLLPSAHTSFPTVALKATPPGAKKKKKSSGLFSCFKPAVDEPDSRDAVGDGYLQYLSDVDCLAQYPGLRSVLQRSLFTGSPHVKEARMSKANLDFSLHGGKVYTGDGATMHGPQNRRGKGVVPSRTASQQGSKQVPGLHLPPAHSDGVLPDVREESEAIPRAAQVAMLSTRGVGSSRDEYEGDTRLCISADNTQHNIPGHPGISVKGRTLLEQALQGAAAEAEKQPQSPRSTTTTTTPDPSEHGSGRGRSRFLPLQARLSATAQPSNHVGGTNTSPLVHTSPSPSSSQVPQQAVPPVSTQSLSHESVHLTPRTPSQQQVQALQTPLQRACNGPKDDGGGGGSSNNSGSHAQQQHATAAS